MSDKYPEYELIRKLVGGDTAAFAELYELYKDKVFAFALLAVKYSLISGLCKMMTS